MLTWSLTFDRCFGRVRSLSVHCPAGDSVLLASERSPTRGVSNTNASCKMVSCLQSLFYFNHYHKYITNIHMYFQDINLIIVCIFIFLCKSHIVNLLFILHFNILKKRRKEKPWFKVYAKKFFNIFF